MAISSIFSFQGRVSRQTYWLTTLGALAVYSLVILGFFGKEANQNGVVALVFFIVMVSYVWIILATSVKRWHDRGKSGWMVFIILIPIVGSIWTLVELGFLPGTAGANHYGDDPL